MSFSGGDSALYGTYIDEPLAMYVAAGQTNSGAYYYHANGLYNIAALTDNSGNAVERYKYEAFGGRSILAPDGTVRTASSYVIEHFKNTRG